MTMTAGGSHLLFSQTRRPVSSPERRRFPALTWAVGLLLSMAACSATSTSPESMAADLGNAIADRLEAPLRLAA